jgi:hypothetical protein
VAWHNWGVPKRLRKRSDVNQLAAAVVEQARAERPAKSPKALISQIMSQMGRKGGRKSGARRMENYTPEERREIAFKAAKARWEKEKRKEKG